MRVLLVDDEELVRRSTERVLRRLGHGVVAVAQGEEALRQYREQRPDVVMLDLEMPGLSGKETLAKLLALDPTAAVVMVTGYGSPERQEEFCALGARQVVAKPWSIASLLATLAQAVEPAE